MVGYAAEVERLMTRLFDSLKESDRRRYAAIEAAKLGHGGHRVHLDPPGLRSQDDPPGPAASWKARRSWTPAAP